MRLIFVAAFFAIFASCSSSDGENQQFLVDTLQRYETDDFILGYSFLAPIRMHAAKCEKLKLWLNSTMDDIRTVMVDHAMGEPDATEISIDWSFVSLLFTESDLNLLISLCNVHFRMLSNPNFVVGMLPKGTFADFDQDGAQVLFRLADLEYFKPYMNHLVPGLLEYHLKCIQTLVHFQVVPLGKKAVSYLFQRLSERMNQLANESFLVGSSAMPLKVVDKVHNELYLEQHPSTFDYSKALIKELWDDSISRYLKVASIISNALKQNGPPVFMHQSNLFVNHLLALSYYSRFFPQGMFSTSVEHLASRTKLSMVLFDRMLSHRSTHKVAHPVYEATLHHYHDKFDVAIPNHYRKTAPAPIIKLEVEHFDSRANLLFAQLIFEDVLGGEVEIVGRFERAVEVLSLQYHLLLSTFIPFCQVNFPPVLAESTVSFTKAWRTIMKRGWGFLFHFLEKADYVSFWYNFLEIVKAEGASDDVIRVQQYFDIYMADKKGKEARMVQECMRLIKI